MSEDKSAENRAQSTDKPEEKAQDKPVEKPAELKAERPAETKKEEAEKPAEAQAPKDTKKEEVPAKKEKPSNCAVCNKPIRKKRWYYRNGKFFCTKTCWSALAKKEKKAEEASQPKAEEKSS